MLDQIGDAARAVGPAAPLAQLHVDPGEEVAAQHLIARR